MQPLTVKFKYQFFSHLRRELVESCNIGQRTKYSQRGPIRYITSLHVPVRPWSDITVDFLKLSPVFTKCSVLPVKISGGEDHVIYISRLDTIVDRQSGFKYSVSVPDNLSTEECTATFDTHVVPTMGYPYYIVFDQDTLLMSSHFQS